MAQSAREIPVLADVDLLVVGGTTAAVAAAAAAGQAGARVFLAAPFSYLGEDICATLRVSRPEPDTCDSSWMADLFGSSPDTTPGQVKAALVRRLVDAGVTFVYGSQATDLLRDADGRICGAVIANRSGRQAIVAKILIDATPYAWVCRQAGCALSPWTGGTVRFERTLLRVAPSAAAAGPPAFQTEVFAFEEVMQDWSYASLNRAELRARAITPGDGLLRAAERLFCVPPFHVCGIQPPDAAASPRSTFEMSGFQAVDEPRLRVLGGCADISRELAERLLKPAGLVPVGIQMGVDAASQAAALPRPTGVRLALPAATARTEPGDIREDLTGGRPFPRSLPTVACGAGCLPVLASVDVVVIGGGTAGAAAAIAAARQGARTLVVETQEGLGGIGTVGLIADPYHGKQIGFAREVPFPRNAEKKMAWYRQEIEKAGGEIWLGALGCGACVNGDVVVGAVVCTPERRGVVRAAVVIDATGSADVAVSAGAAYRFGDIEAGDLALQGAGLSVRIPGADQKNSDFLLVDEADLTDVWRALVSVQLARRQQYDVTPMIQSRERRRVIGEFTMRYVDQLAGRTYPDAVVHSGSDYDSHGYPSSPLFALLPHDAVSRLANHPAPGGTCFTPYRSLLPRGLEGLLVCGLGISMDRDATAMVRMQYDLANQGYAAGVAAAMAVAAGVPPRRIDVRALQRHLVATGNLPSEVLEHVDSFPLPDAAVHQAVVAYGAATEPLAAGKPLAILLTHPTVAAAALKRALGGAAGPSRILYAQALAVLGGTEGVPTLIEALSRVAEWDAKIFQGRMADYAYLPTPVDALVLALGLAGDRSAVPAILRLARLLDADVTLSHHRSVALALERLADPAAAEALSELLGKPGMTGHTLTTLSEGPVIEARTASLREITLARALFHCGDFHGLGRSILERYRDDLRGLFARHARAVLTPS